MPKGIAVPKHALRIGLRGIGAGQGAAEEGCTTGADVGPQALGERLGVGHAPRPAQAGDGLGRDLGGPRVGGCQPSQRASRSSAAVLMSIAWPAAASSQSTAMSSSVTGARTKW
jgi:hypothetical protein